jgi:hypothetical protein
MKSTIEIVTKEIGNVIEIEENVGMMKIIWRRLDKCRIYFNG